MATYHNPVPTTDCIIEYRQGNRSGIVLVERGREPFRGRWALPGGFTENGLTFEQNAVKEAKEETNLDIIILNPGRPYVYSNPDRDPRGHIVANVYDCLGFGTLRGGDDAARAAVFSRECIRGLISGNRLAFDHGMILHHYFARS